MQGDDGVGAADGPEHTGFFEAGTDDRLTAGFDYTRANEQMLASKLGVAHTLGIFAQNSRPRYEPCPELRRYWVRWSATRRPVFDFAFVEQPLLVDFHLGLLIGWIVRV